MGTTAQKLNKILQTKSEIKNAIEAKGVSVGNIPFDEYSDKIGEISGGSITLKDFGSDLYVVVYKTDGYSVLIPYIPINISVDNILQTMQVNLTIDETFSYEKIS